MSSPGFEAPDIESSISRNSTRRNNPSNLRAYWQDIKAYNESEIHNIETTPERFKSEEDDDYFLKVKLAMKSFPGRFGPTLDLLAAAFRKGDEKETKWLAHRALCISESRLQVLAKYDSPCSLKAALEEINEILLKLKTDGTRADIKIVP